jgi:hypothetical protein
MTSTQPDRPRDNEPEPTPDPDNLDPTNPESEPMAPSDDDQKSDLDALPIETTTREFDETF